MDYESRKVKWYWLTLFLIYCGGVAYLLFAGNPYLYSHLDLKAALSGSDQLARTTIPAHPTEIKPGSPTFHQRYNLQRTAVDPEPITRGKNYQEYQHFAIDTGIADWKVQNISGDSTGFYLTGNKPWVVAIGLDGKVRWKFHFQKLEDARDLPAVLLDQSSAYVVQPGGDVVSLDKQSGEIRWMLPLRDELVARPILFHADVLIPVRSQAAVSFVLVRRADGHIEDNKPELDIKPGFELSASNDENTLYATVDNKVIAITTEDEWQIDWTQTLTDPIRGPAVIVGNQIYVATLGAKIVKLDAANHGRMDWDSDLQKPALAAPSYLPIVNHLAVIDGTGALNTIDAKTGKFVWRYNIEAHNPLKETWSARLMGHYIEEFKMDWLHKGWTIWAPCSQRRFCIYAPKKGQLINRIPLSGSPMALPLTVGRELVFLLEDKPGHYLVSQVLEDSEIKKLERAKPADSKKEQ